MEFVGRAAELDALGAAYTRAVHGEAAAVVVIGEAGMGKTRLVGEFADRVPALPLTGCCLDMSLSFAPFIAILRRLVREFGAEWAHGEGRPELARLLPEFGAVEPDDGLRRTRLFEEVLLLLEQAAERRPLLVVVEDLHWADRSTRDLFVFLSHNLTRPGILLIGTSRPYPAALGNAEIMELDGMARSEIADLVGAGADVEHIFRRSDGNPLFAQELARAGGVLPARLLDVLLAGADRLPPGSRAMLDAAAVLGGPVTVELLAEVATAPEAAVQALVEARFLVADDGGYVFRHALIGEAVYGELLPGERRKLHARCAARLSGRARALHQRAAGDVQGAFTAAWRAAESAHESHAYGEELEMLDLVRELWHQVPDRLGLTYVTVAERAAQAAYRYGDTARALALLTAVTRSVPVLEPQDPTREEVLRDLREAMPPASPQERASSLALLARILFVIGNGTAAGKAEEALELATDPEVRANALITLSGITARTGDLAKALPLYERARTLAPSEATRLSAMESEADALETAGEHEAAAALARQGMEAALRAGRVRRQAAILAANLAGSLTSLGRWAEATEVVRGILALDPLPIQRSYLLIVRGTIAVATGNLDEARQALATAQPLLRRRPLGQTSCLEADLLECRLAEAQDDLSRRDRVAGHILDDHDLTTAGRDAWPILSRLVGCRRTPEVRSLGERLAVQGRLQHAHRVTFEARSSGGRAGWAGAVEAWRAVGQPYELARALFEAGRLPEAASIAAELGATPLLKAIESRADPARRPESLGLTPRELEVLRLVADGLSNMEIAGRLFITPKTAGAHVSNILSKLGVTSRTAAAAIAHRRELFTGSPR
ncbi:AAA family ATPase [Nonomuraea sp. NPDC050404]|uniref:ATP-binding protein n=1 Tax=Nonomuraea sp. NPDC050404 TaxID=3155783 RepID=UPI0033C8CB5F